MKLYKKSFKGIALAGFFRIGIVCLLRLDGFREY